MRNGIEGILRFLSVVAFVLILILKAIPAIGQEPSDCNPSMDFEIDDTLLTRDEVIALMDKRFYDSLAEYQECLGGGGGGGASQSSSGGSGDGQSSSQIESVAATGIQGTELPPTDSNGGNNARSPHANIQTPDNGKIPEDIPPADNDGALAAQIRLAAENETDPVKQAELWNEYRRFKGLPLK